MFHSLKFKCVMGQAKRTLIRAESAASVEEIVFPAAIGTMGFPGTFKGTRRQADPAVSTNGVVVGGDGVKALTTKDIGKAVVENIPASAANLWERQRIPAIQHPAKKAEGSLRFGNKDAFQHVFF
jgi:hypothetical protein